MRFTVELTRHDGSACQTKVELEQVWQTRSKFASVECNRRSKKVKQTYSRYQPNEVKQRLDIPCQQLTNDETSTMKIDRTENVPCNSLLKYYAKGCCWIPFVQHTPEGTYDTTFTLNTSKRTDGKLNRPPRTFIPPALRVPIDMEETSQVNIFDPDFDSITCRVPNRNDDCRECASIDNINPKTKNYVRVNKDCSLTTNFPSSYEGKYFKTMFVIEEREKRTGAFLSKSSNLMLLIPAKLKCGERGQTTIKVIPDDKKFIPGKQYTMVTMTKPPCGEVEYKKSIFSVVPPGSKVSNPIMKDGMLSQNMTFIANEKLCEQMMHICAYSMDSDDFQSRAACEKIFCRGYEHLLGEDEAAARKKKIIAGSVAGLLLLLLLLGLLLGLFLWHRSRNQEDDSTEGSSEDESTEVTPPPKYKPAPKKEHRAAVASSILDDDDD